MTQEAAVPAGFWERVEQVCERVLDRYIRSGSMRNSSLTGGSFTLRGGVFRMRNALDTFSQFYLGPSSNPQPDGTPQPVWVVRRADGTVVIQLFDAFPEDGPDGVKQALSILDRTGNTIVSDDTDSGEGVGRPWLHLHTPVPTVFTAYPATSSASFAAIAISWNEMQHPKVYWFAQAVTDAGTTAEVRLNIDSGATLGPVTTVPSGGSVSIGDTIALPAGFHGQLWRVAVEARVTGGPGSVRVQTFTLLGRQT